MSGSGAGCCASCTAKNLGWTGKAEADAAAAAVATFGATATGADAHTATPKSRPFIQRRTRLASVSYTHLDVYKRQTIGFDIAKHKVQACLRGTDPSRELEDAQMAEARHAIYTDDPAMLAEADMIIVAVPTPVDEAHIPDFRPLIGSSTSVGRHMKKGVTVVYESTVYPGATEEVCIPVLEKESGMKWKQDFFVGYSPERINPGDKEHRVTTIRKVTSGSTPEAAAFVDALYRRIITAGTHQASSIRVLSLIHI